MARTVQYGMLIELSSCVGCNACVVACKQENDLPVGKYNTWIESWDSGDYPNVKRANLPKLCNHCGDEAPCLLACPTGATHLGEGGMVLISEDECIGCKACMAACPYQARWLNDETDTVEKCTFCANRSTKGLLPSCAGICPSHARLFGDVNDPESEISKRLAEIDPEKLYKEFGLDVHVYYSGLTKTMQGPTTSAVLYGGRRAKAD